MKKKPLKAKSPKNKLKSSKGKAKSSPKAKSPRKAKSSPKSKSPKAKSPKARSPQPKSVPPRYKVPQVFKTKPSYAPDVPIPELHPYYTPQKIAQIFAQEVRTIEGPSSYYILTPTRKLNDMIGHSAPVMVLFGDYHTGDKRCNTKCVINKHCYSFWRTNPTIIKFLNDFGKKIHIDLFLETWLTTKERKRSLWPGDDRYGDEPAGALRSIKNHLVKCLQIEDGVRHEECPATNFYVHMSDTRFAKDKIDAILANDMPVLPYATMAYRLKRMFPNLTMQRLLQLVRQRLLMGPKAFMEKVARHDPLFHSYSKSMKQMMALPPALQTLIYKHYHYDLDDCNTLPANKLPRVANDASDTNLRREYNEYQQMFRTSIVQNCYWSGFASELDLYFLGRSLKTPQGGPNSQLSVGYFGNFHVISLVEFLTSKGLYSIFTHKSHAGKRYEDKCVSL